MSFRKDIRTVEGWLRGRPGCRLPAWRRARPALEELEDRLAPSVGGGWISSTQLGQSGDGFLGQYYSNAKLSGAPSFTRWDNRVDFSWTDGNADPGGSTDPAFQSVGPDNWSAQWTGTLTANFSETYTFQVNSAGNGVELWVAPVGQPLADPIINDGTSHGPKTDTATMTLQAGQDYNVELELSETNASVQQIQLEWSSPSTPLEDIEPVTEVGLNVDGEDALFANMVNGDLNDFWSVPGNLSLGVPTDANLWPEADAEVSFGEGDQTTEAGGAYLVQFTGMATVTNTGDYVDWLVNGTDLQSTTLQAGQGYDPSTNTTTATMVVAPGAGEGFWMSFTNTSRNANSPLAVTAINDAGAIVTVSVPSVAGMDPNKLVTIAGFTGSAAGYNGTFVITSVNSSNNTFTYVAANYATGLPTNPSGGTALANPENGITDLYVMQPTTLGGNTPCPVGTLFTPAALSLAAQYSVLRFMSLNATIGNLTSNWSDRTLPSDSFWTGYTFNSESGVDTGVSGTSPLAGVPWEVQIALANESGKDVYINIPVNASASYLTNLADLFAYGSNGVTPYTSVQADPVWAPLDPNLKVYIEFSNELWNYGDVQAESRADGWANQLSQRTLYDYLTNIEDDPLYPGGGSNAYSDGAVLASYFGVNSTNDSTFLNTYNADPAPSGDGGSPEYFSNSSSLNGSSTGQAWVGLRNVQISNAFKTAFGETNVNAVATDSRVRPVFEWQFGSLWSGALGFIADVYGAEHPVSYYLYGGGGSWYADNTVGGFSDVSFTNPGFADGLTGWSSSGSAGVVANGSAMGNPNAPPLFSAIAVNDGATESGNTVTITTSSPHNFVAGQTVSVSGVTVSGYNGTFTITSVTLTTFTYEDSTTGLANSGDGIVSGTDSSGQTAYLQPGASISQNVTFSGGYADLTLYATQNVPGNLYHYNGLFVTLTPANGGPAINNGQPISLSEGSAGSASFSGSEDDFVWDQSEAFYTGASDYTYTVTFSNTLPAGTVFLDSLAIQTVNGMFNETTAAVQSALSVSGEVEAEVNLTLQYGLHEVDYEGGYDFNQNLSGGYQQIGNVGYSSSVPNVGASANLDPRTEQLENDTLDEFFAAGGTLPIVFESTGNINSWAVAAPTYFNWDTPKLEAAGSVEQTAQPATYGLKPGQSDTSANYWLNAGQTNDDPLESVYLVPDGSYTLTISIQWTPGAPPGEIDPVEVIVDGQLIDTINVYPADGGTFTVDVGYLAAGQHAVELYDNAPASNDLLYLGPPGTPVLTLEYAPTSITWVAPSPIVYGTALGSSQLDATANVPGTFSYTPAAGAILTVGLDTLSVTFTPSDTTDYSTATATTTITVTSSSVDNPSALFVTDDTSTQGNWIGTYGTQGYDIIGGPSDVPTYATVTPAGEWEYTWSADTSDPRALQAPGTGSRVAGGWFEDPSFTVDVDLTDGQTHDISLYFLEYDNGPRTEQIQLTSATTGAVLSTETISNFTEGVYLEWAISGNVVITFTDLAGQNAMLSGIFFDPAGGSSSPPGSSASFLQSDTTTEGNWIGTYGTQGYDIIGGPSDVPTYATVTPAGEWEYTWTTDTSDPRALQAPGTGSRVAGGWFEDPSFTVDVDLTDGQTHDISLYFLEYDNGPRTEQIQLTSAATGAVLSTETISNFTGGVYLEWAISGNVVITFTDLAGQNAMLSGIFFDPPGGGSSAPGSSASFLQSDTTTQGNWIGTYGTQGYDIIGGPSDVPTYATVTPAGEWEYTWSADTSDPRALQAPGTGSRVAGGWFEDPSFTVDLDLTDGQTHDISLYFLEYDNGPRTEQIQIASATTGAVLSTETISNFTGGVYLEWAISGNVVITFTDLAGQNAMLSGIFFDPAGGSSSPPGSSASFLQSDTTTQGNWIGTYGTQGYDIIGGPSDVPTSATVTPAGEWEYTWTTDTSDPRALQAPGTGSRVAGGWFEDPSFTVDVDLTDGQTHDISLYFLEYDNGPRTEQIQIASATTGAVLSTETIANFTGGVYLEWAISGNVVITFTDLAGQNAMLSGIFFDPAAGSSSPPGSSASFLQSDTTTEGNWIGTYGTQGYDIIGGPSDVPTYATVTPAGEWEYTWSADTSDPRALQAPGTSSRVAGGWFEDPSFTVDVDLTDGQTHDISLYFLEYDNGPRTEQIQIASATTGAVLSTETIANFTGGVYLEWAISGNVVITFTDLAGQNAMLSGIFFDPATSSNDAIGDSAQAGGSNEIGAAGMLGADQLRLSNATGSESQAVTTTGTSITLVNEHGQLSSAYLASSNQIVATDWGGVVGTVITTSTGLQIDWSNGTTWFE